MSFKNFETSRDKGLPSNIYFFRWGTAPSSFFAYTNGEKDITYNGVTYKAVPISRSNIVASGKLDKASLEISLPLNLELPVMFLSYPPPQVVTCIIRQGHLNDPDGEFLVIWAGRIVNVKREDNEAVLQGEPVSTSMRRNGLRRNYQYSCPHVLYGAQCKASEAAATITSTANSVESSAIGLPGGWNGEIDADSYIGGLVKWTNGGNIEVRTILRVEDDGLKILLSGVTRGLTSGQGIQLVLGCNHQMSGCNLHNNIQNFGGFPWIPKKNPIGSINNYY